MERFPGGGRAWLGLVVWVWGAGGGQVCGEVRRYEGPPSVTRLPSGPAPCSRSTCSTSTLPPPSFVSPDQQPGPGRWNLCPLCCIWSISSFLQAFFLFQPLTLALHSCVRRTGKPRWHLVLSQLCTPSCPAPPFSPHCEVSPQGLVALSHRAGTCSHTLPCLFFLLEAFPCTLTCPVGPTLEKCKPNFPWLHISLQLRLLSSSFHLQASKRNCLHMNCYSPLLFLSSLVPLLSGFTLSVLSAKVTGDLRGPCPSPAAFDLCSPHPASSLVSVMLQAALFALTSGTTSWMAPPQSLKLHPHPHPQLLPSSCRITLPALPRPEDLSFGCALESPGKRFKMLMPRPTESEPPGEGRGGFTGSFFKAPR